MVPYIVPDALHNSIESHKLPKCYPGTREAIKKDLIQWVENMQRRHPIYYLHAPVGSGKTAIAKTLADHFSDPKHSYRRYLLASFFFSRYVEGRNNARRLIATIAYQIAINLPRAAPFIAKALIRDPNIVNLELQAQMHTLILEPLRKACQEAPVTERANWPRLLVIDGLDECQEQETQVGVLQVVSELAEYQPLPLAIFISCRPELVIRGEFQTEHLNKSSLQVSLPEEYKSEDDIRYFMNSKFKEIRDAHIKNTGIEFPPIWPGDQIVDMLVRKSSGHFIYPSVVVKYVGASDDNPVKRLDNVCGLPDNNDGENPFTQLDALYTHILASIKDTHLPTVVDAFSFALVPSLLRPPDGIDSTSYFLVDEAELRTSLANLQGVLVMLSSIQESIGTTFLHASFSDYLQDINRSGKYCISIAEAHANIVMYLLKRHIENSGTPTSISCLLPPDSISRLANTGSFVTAISTLILHLRVAATTGTLYRQLQNLSQPMTTIKVISHCNRLDEQSKFYNSWEALLLLSAGLGQSVSILNYLE